MQCKPDLLQNMGLDKIINNTTMISNLIFKIKSNFILRNKDKMNKPIILIRITNLINNNLIHQ